jgi:alkylation response protein AidB-like acyl-CoA dehydrogenase
VINGQKIYTSLASYADYIWLAARTDPDAPKHAGITIFAVPTTDPGFSYSKISTMVDASTFNTFYDNVRVGDDAVIAGVNKGWHLITNQLNYERVSLGPPGMVERVFDEVRRWTQDTKLPDGRRVADQEWVQLNIARVHAKLEFVKLINWKVAASGGANPADASATKVFATEFYTEAYRLLMEVLGPNAYLRRSDAHALAGRLERAFQGCLILTFGGGVNEVQRDLIALFGTGLPRVPRH